MTLATTFLAATLFVPNMPSPDAKGNLELIVRVYKNESGQVFIGTLLHTKGGDIAAKLAPPKQ